MLTSHGAIVSVTLLTCISIAGFFNTGVNGAIKELKSFDPESLYEYFKDQDKSIDTANKAEVDGLAYFTPMSKQLIDDGEVYMSKRNVLDYYYSLSNQNKRDMYNAQKKIKSCWDDARNHTQNLLRYYKNCPYSRSDKCQFFNYRQIIKGNIQLKLVSCMSQKTDGEVFNSSPIIHIKAGTGAPFLLYASKGTGVVFNLRNPTDSRATATGCYTRQAVNPCHRRPWNFDWLLGEDIYVDDTRRACRYGILYEESLTMSFTVSYFSDMDDLLHKNFHTVQIGVDVPGLEVGIDVLLHFSFYGTPIGFGFAFGMGFRLVPFDFATDNCYTYTMAEYKDSVHIFSRTDMGRPLLGPPLHKLSCDLNLLGVISEETRYRHYQVCCPENNPSLKCNTAHADAYGIEYFALDCRCNEYCLFRYRCPHTPQELYSSKGLKFIISRSSCPGQTYIAEAHYDKKKCIDLWKLDKRQKYMQYKLDSGECWFGDTNSIDFCVWAPSEASVIYHR